MLHWIRSLDRVLRDEVTSLAALQAGEIDVPIWGLCVVIDAVMLAVLASIGPIVAFFSLTTTSYPFAILLNVTVFGIAGLLGLTFLLRTLHRLAAARAGLELQFAMTADAVGPLDPSRNAGPDRSVVTIFRLWVIVFALVGTQMAWVLSPFVGHTSQKFVLFRPTGSNFFQGVLNNVENLAAGKDNHRGGHDRE